MKDGHNLHHLNWQRREWSQSHITRRIRENPGMIIRLPIPVHNELHAEIPPMRPPHLVLARVILASLASQEGTAYEVVPATTNFLWDLAEADNQLGHESYRWALHLEEQMQFLGMRET